MAGLRSRARLQRAPLYYVVQPGDTLSAIAATHGVDIEAVALLNGIRDPRSLKSGVRLYLGYSGGGGFRTANLSTGGSSLDELGSAALGWPLQGGRLSSTYGRRGRSFHDGIDIAAPVGTPVYAAHDGVVVYSDDGLSGYGNLVIIRGRSGLTTVYAHNRRNLVELGELVDRGEQIAEVGTTGRSTGPHLHFEVRTRDSRGRFVSLDPLPVLKGNRAARPASRVNERLTPILANSLSSG